MTTIRMTYMGGLSCAGASFFCTDMSGTVDINPQFYDHVMGLNDVGIGNATKGSVGGSGQSHTQKKIYRLAQKLPKASFSGPVLENGNVMNLLSAAISGDINNTCQMTFTSTGDGCTISDAVVSNITFSVAAGDVSNFSCEMVGLGFTPGAGLISTPCHKLLTWDKVVVTASGPNINTADGCASFSLTISNPVIPIYTAGSNDARNLYPKQLRIGTQEVSGSIAINRFAGATAGKGTVAVALPGGSLTANVFFGAGNSAGNSGRFLSTVPFTGVNDGPVFGF